MLLRPLGEASTVSLLRPSPESSGRSFRLPTECQMQRYFFHVHDGYSSIDEDGTMLSSLQAAREEAVQTAADILRDSGKERWMGKPWRLEVTDIARKLLFTLHFSV